MKQTWRRVLLVLVCCVLAFVGWVWLLRLADTISAARSYKSSPAELRAAADAAVLPAADPAFTGSSANDQYGKLEKSAKDIMAKNAGMTFEKAFAMACDADPDTYKKYVEGVK